ncbi:MAG: hypothetical protein KF764_03085 [Labilithrix sp.]|nr:hypothetical protein [Labilithrix sp.]
MTPKAKPRKTSRKTRRPEPVSRVLDTEIDIFRAILAKSSRAEWLASCNRAVREVRAMGYMRREAALTCQLITDEIPPGMKLDVQYDAARDISGVIVTDLRVTTFLGGGARYSVSATILTSDIRGHLAVPR